jgi:polyhydroxybutyrate depolymerase
MFRLSSVLGAVLSITLALASGCTSDPASTTGVAPTLPRDGDAGDPDQGRSPQGTSDAGDAGESVASPLTARPYRATVPSKYDAAVATPLVVLLHGYSATSKVQDDYFKLSALAETKTFLVALPDGLKDPKGNQFWNATDACCGFLGSPTDDVAYLRAVIADMKAKYNVDPKRVYIIGHSNGGFMAHRLACELSGEIAAIVSLAGASFADPAKCLATEPVAVLQVHGDADDTIRYSGGSIGSGVPAYPGAKETVAMWAAKNGCSPDRVETSTRLDLDTKLAGDETKVARHACTRGAAELWTIEGGSHIPSFQPTWAPLIYGFLEAHPKP